MGLYEDYIKPTLDGISEDQIQSTYLRWEYELLSIENALKTLPKYHTGLTILSFGAAFFLEHFISKQFSWGRQTIYTMSIYAFIISLGTASSLQVLGTSVSGALKTLREEYSKTS
mgnify:CR=1 FL=1